MNSWFWIAPIGAILALVFALYLANRVKKTDQGSPAMIKISEAVRRGADAFLHRQHKLVLIVFIVIFVILGILALIGVRDRSYHSHLHSAVLYLHSPDTSV